MDGEVSLCAAFPPPLDELLRHGQAILFGYFEALLRLGDPMKVLAEESRLKSLNNLLNAVGFQEDLYEDFVDETLSLLRETATSIPCQDNGAALLSSFNDAGVSNAIITHFRVSAYR